MIIKKIKKRKAIQKLTIETLENQSNNLEEVVSVIQQINASVQEVTSKMHLSSVGNEKNIEIMDDYNVKVTDLNNNISELFKVGSKTDEILKGISYISEQTHLLSLNASIESARAGADGRAFSVIANEMTKLNASAKVENDKIKSILMELTNLLNICCTDMEVIKEGTEKLTKDTVIRADSINVILANMEEVSSAMEELSSIAETQSTDFQDILKKLKE